MSFSDVMEEEIYLECTHCGECYALGYSYCVKWDRDEDI